jgi:histidinol dehydrogenase
MIAGPSEIFIIADDSGNPEFIAADLLSQAEHDEQAIPILTTTSRKLANEVISELKSQTKRSARSQIIKNSLSKNCKIFFVKNLKDAARISNSFAPEHLELAVKYPNRLLKLIDSAGAVFLGHFTPEAIGDYVAGPNHVLPTGGTARFFSPLGVYDFYKRTSLISYNKAGLKNLAETVVNIAEIEGFHAHAEAVRIRIQGKKKL